MYAVPSTESLYGHCISGPWRSISDGGRMEEVGALFAPTNTVEDSKKSPSKADDSTSQLLLSMQGNK